MHRLIERSISLFPAGYKMAGAFHRPQELSISVGTWLMMQRFNKSFYFLKFSFLVGALPA
jgi:hypothetical protein